MLRKLKKIKKTSHDVSEEILKSEEMLKKSEKSETVEKSEKTKTGENNGATDGDLHSPRIVNRLVGSLGSALDENEDEIEDIDEYLSSPGTDFSDGRKVEMSLAADGVKPFPRRVYIFLGIIVLILSVIGAVSCVNFISGTVNDVIDKRSLKSEFALFLYPVVITDPPEFTDTDNLQPLTIISSSLWKIILNEDTEKYEKSMGMMTVPAIDVEASARSLFGYGYEMQHQTIDDIDITFEYNPEKNSYIVPEKPRYMTYVPRIKEITNTGEIFYVTVEYIAPSTLSIVGIQYEEEPIKTLVYTISRSKDKKMINSIVNVSEPEK